MRSPALGGSKNEDHSTFGFMFGPAIYGDHIES